ncbi:MAG: glycosyltransferase family 4 protein [Oscillospiraceae bacterium]|nr:glycosyltransferase family 4 protein [Oscillospiraceae bacterium]
MKKKKVLFVATVVKTHMMQFHIPYLKMFQEMGWETAVASKNDYENPEDCQIPYCDTYYNIPFERMPWKPKNWTSYKMLKKIIDEGEYDIIHCHTPVGAMIARLAALSARKKGTRVIYTAHGFHFFKGAPLINWLLFYPAEWLLAPVTDVLITINREDHARALKRLHAKRIEYVPGVGIDTHKFRNLVLDREEKRKTLGYGNDDFLILTVAEMTPNKNHITVLKALALLKDTEEFRNIHYLICGRGEMWASLEQSAKELGIADHVNFLGYRSDAPELYRSCDLFAFMTFREGLSVALMEAMSSAMPIACTKIRGNTDLIEDGVSGVFVENTPEATAEAFLKLYREPEYRKALGAAASERALLFDNEAVHRQVKEIYLSV